MRADFLSPAMKVPGGCLEKTEESSLYRQPMSDRQWQHHVAVVKTRIALLDQGMIAAAVGAIRSAFDWLDPLMENYCEITCPACGDICCRATGVFFNLTDLLVILGMGLAPPVGQTRSHASEPCRYGTRTGCTLTRIVRPYVCVWYLCEAQMELHREEPASTQRRLVATLESLRRNRLRLESHYESLFPPPLF